ncbi:DUF2806 domain-containing protein [Mesorhizobium sp. M0106]|uniref:DUF2806 domain-containing protein n=1 Tax=Mesorhizobium sp. M0106 TaxID=2956880 RepID=UPI0033371C11
MTDEPTPNETGLTIGVTGNSIEIKVRSRFVRAWDYFFGAKAEFKGLGIEREILLARTKQANEAKIIDALGDAAVERIKSDRSLAEVLVDSHFNGVMREQTNLAATLQKAEEQTRLLPPPSNHPVDGSEGAEIEDDFLNMWGHYAKSASSERMRTFLGRILAGEAQQPGSFSFSTLRVAAELDASTATIFKNEANQRLAHALVRDTEDDTDVNPYVTLEAAGLIQGVGSMLTANYDLRTTGILDLASGSFRITMQLIDRSATKLPVPIYPLTKVGKELASILPRDHERGLRLIAKTCADQCSDIKLMVRPEPTSNAVYPGGSPWVVLEVLKQQQPPVETAVS